VRVPPRLRLSSSHLHRGLRASTSCSDAVRGVREGAPVKGQQKQKKMAKKPAQKTLKERRTEKRAADKQVRPDGV